MRNRSVPALQLLAVLALLNACGSGGTGPEPEPTYETFAGAYQLATVDNQPLPARWADMQQTVLHVRGGVLHTTAEGNYRYDWDGQKTDKDSGATGRIRIPLPNGGIYTLDGREVHFQSAYDGDGIYVTGGSTYSGTVDPPDEVQVRMSVDGQTRTLIFRR